MVSRLISFMLSYVSRRRLITMSRWVLPLLKRYYKGSGYIDPIDKSNLSKLLPYGYVHRRENALSPSTLSLERHRLMWLYLERCTDFFQKPYKLLHVAPEQPFYKRFRSLPHIDYTTVDLESPIADIKADLTFLPFENNSFDVIFCNHVLEHIADDTKAMKELYRVMRPGGWGIFQVPLDRGRKETYEDFSVTKPKDREIHFGQYDHVRIYGQDYFYRLESTGFSVVDSEFLNSLSNDEIKSYALNCDEVLPIVEKC